MPPANFPSDTPNLSPFRSESLASSTNNQASSQFSYPSFSSSPSPLHLPSSAADTVAPISSSRPRLPPSYGTAGSPAHASHQPQRTQRHSLDLSTTDGRYRRYGISRVQGRRGSRDLQYQEQRHQAQDSGPSRAYGPRIPILHPGQRQSVYDWAPALFNADDNAENWSSSVLPPIIGPGSMNFDPLRDLPTTLRPYSRLQFPNAAARTTSPPVIFTEPSSTVTATPPQTSENSPFRTAVLQSIRNSNPRRSVRYRPSWPAPEWSSAEREENLPPPRLEWSDSEPPRFRHRYRGHDSSAPTGLPDASHEVTEVIRYLSNVRNSQSVEESLHLLNGSSLDAFLDVFDNQPLWNDLLLDTVFLTTSETSWLKAGGVFWGTQTTPPSPGYHSQRSAYSSITSASSSLPSNTTTGIPSDVGPIRSSIYGDQAADPNSGVTRWTVKVNISSVDYNQMRLTGTMEAFLEHHKGSINTYLEGEIIDFNHHSFQTTNFVSEIITDAQNWRKLEPFVNMTNEEIVRGLLSRKFMKELANHWVFMRWKEKCFIDPQTDDGVLTIGGFYFLALRRSDGKVQGFYHDTGSLSYQELVLSPSKRLFPTYEFR